MLHSPSKHKDFGVFLPVANGGWIISSTTPVTDGLDQDGLMLIFPDYVEGPAMFGADILPGPRAVYS